jgi:1,4-dihydroxy-2-naphthoate octaprenyltransferase
LGLHYGGIADRDLLIVGYLGVTLIMLMTYYSNEYFDYEGDVINRNYNRFSGGSRVLSEGILPRRAGLYLMLLALFSFVILLVIYLRCCFNVRPYLLPMALVGVLAGLFYSAPPFRWAYRGVGEVLIGFSYGWLATTSGYYIVTGRIDLASTLLSLPATFTVFSVIVINEIPDYEADLAVSKRNLVVRLGVNRAKVLYTVSNVMALATASIAGFYVGGLRGSFIALVTLTPLLLYPVALLLENPGLSSRFLENLSKITILSNAIATYPVVLSAFILNWWL